MLTPNGYRPRLIDAQISQLMNIYGAVCVEGPKWCGKTWTSRNHAESATFIGDPAGNFMNKQLAELDASLVLEGKLPRLIDEWQVVPAIWDAVRYKVDQTGNKGQYVLTGSSTPVMKGKLHGGSGRIGRITMRTMSLYETGHSSGAVSIMDLFNDSLSVVPVQELQLDELISYVVRGGWPGIQELPLKSALQIPRDYLLNIPDDMERSDGRKRDAKKVTALLRALGRAESNMTSKKSLQKDMEEYAEDREDMREASIDTITPKRHFTDPSLAAAAIGATPQMLRYDLNTFGYLFEALCVRDLRIYSDNYDGKVYHYHDERDNEADAVVELPDGRWGLFEIKVGFHQVESAAQELIRLSSKFKAETNSEASFLCVLCGMSNAAFKRSDGVFVVPITALGI